MRKSLTLGFLLMGFSFTVTQGLLIRELLVAFNGNELSIGLVLGSWLILEAAGSAVPGRLAGRWGRQPASFASLQVLFALFLPLCLGAVYASRSIVGAMPGEGVGLVPIAWASFLILAPLGLVDGAMFAFGASTYAHLIGKEAPAISRVYVLEALGGLVGGLVFTFLFIPFLYSIQIVLVLCALNLLVAALILAEGRSARALRRILIVGLALLAALGLIAVVSPGARVIQHWAQGWRWPGYDLVYSENSVYGNVAVVQRQEQYTFFADGIPVLTAPVPDVAAVEELVHLPLLFVPEPTRVLVLSGGVGGVLNELAKYPLEQIDYAELDPLLIEAVHEFSTPMTASELAEPRLRLEPVDGRLLVGQKQREVLDGLGLYELVVVNLPYPSTLQLNRFYTVEFYQMVRNLVAEKGVLVVASPGSLSYLSEELRNLNLMVHASLREVFPSTRPIPGEMTLWLASPSEASLAAPQQVLVDRWLERDLATRLVTPDHIRLRLDQRYLDWFWSSLNAAPGTPEAEVLPLQGGDQGQQGRIGQRHANRDLHPVGLFYGLAYWNALLSPGMARILILAGGLKLWMLALPLFAASFVFLVVAKATGRGKDAAVPLAVAATGFTGMTADLIVILAFQSLYGHVYHWVGLLIATFMAGLALGGWLTARGSASRTGDQARSALLRLEVALILFWLLMPLLLVFLHSRQVYPSISIATQFLLFLLNATAGFLVGAQFPVANELWLQGRAAAKRSTGALYASDLVGAFVAAVLVSVLLVPVLGIVATCLLAATIKAASFVLVITLAR
jgi:spermidine synthase